MNDTAVVICYYKNSGHLFQCLDSIFDTPSCDFYLVENRSDVDISDKIFGYISEGKIKKYALFDDNICNNAPRIFLLDENVNWENYKYIVYTDGDLVPDVGWLDECKKALDCNKELFIMAVSLYMDNLPINSFPESINWIPDEKVDCGDYLETTTGCHFMTFRVPDFQKYLAFITTKTLSVPGTVFTDYHMHNFVKSTGHKSGRTKISKARHLVWDYYQDLNHPYTLERLKNPYPWSPNTACKYEVFS